MSGHINRSEEKGGANKVNRTSNQARDAPGFFLSHTYHKNQLNYLYF
jgi:hypothetical protein